MLCTEIRNIVRQTDVSRYVRRHIVMLTLGLFEHKRAEIFENIFLFYCNITDSKCVD